MTREKANIPKVFIFLAVWIALCTAAVAFLLLSKPGRETGKAVKAQVSRLLVLEDLDIDEQLEAEMERIRQAGEPMTVEEVIPPEIPNQKNAAALYEKAFEKLELSEEDEDTLWDLMCSLPRSSDQASPAPETLEAIVAKNREAIGLLYAARNRPESRFSLEWEKGVHMLFSELTSASICGRLLIADALVHMKRGETEKAVEGLRSALRIAGAVGHEPMIVNHYSAYRGTIDAIRMLQKLLHGQRIPGETCRRLYGDLTGVHPGASLQQGLITYRAMVIEDAERLRANPEALSDYLGEDVPSGSAFIDSVLRAHVDAGMVTFLRYARRQIELVEKPYRLASEELKALEERFEPELDRHPLAYVFALPIDGNMAQRDAARAHIGLAQVGLALEAYRNETGHLPETLDDIAEVVEWAEMPEDPFSGEDFVYRREGDEFTLYSIGRNLEDDGGETADHADEGDIVW